MNRGFLSRGTWLLPWFTVGEGGIQGQNWGFSPCSTAGAILGQAGPKLHNLLESNSELTACDLIPNQFPYDYQENDYMYYNKTICSLIS